MIIQEYINLTLMGLILLMPMLWNDIPRWGKMAFVSIGFLSLTLALIKLCCSSQKDRIAKERKNI